MSADDIIIFSIVTELNKSKGCIIEFESDYKQKEDGVYCYVRFKGELARTQERCCREFINLSNEERMRAVELVIRSALKYALPALTLPDECELNKLLEKEKESKNHVSKLIVKVSLDGETNG